MKSSLHSLIPFLSCLLNHLLLSCEETPSILSQPSQSQVKVTLRLTVSQSVCLGVETRLGLMTRCFFLFESYCPVRVGVPSLTRGRVCRLSVIFGSISSLSFVQLFTILLLKPNRMYNIYKASVSPGSLQQTMPYFYLFPRYIASGRTQQKTLYPSL
jgi:hypothetical protein